MFTITALPPSFPSPFSPLIPWALSIPNCNPVGGQPISVSDCLLTVVLVLLPLLDPLHQQVDPNLAFDRAHHRIPGCGADYCSSSHSNHVCLGMLLDRCLVRMIVSWKSTSSTLRGGWETSCTSQLSESRMPLFCHFYVISADGRGFLLLRQ